MSLFINTVGLICLKYNHSLKGLWDLSLRVFFTFLSFFGDIFKSSCFTGKKSLKGLLFEGILWMRLSLIGKRPPTIWSTWSTWNVIWLRKERLSDPSVLSFLFSVDVAHKAFCKGGGGVCGDHRRRKKDNFKGPSLSSWRISSQFNHRRNMMIVAYIMMIVLAINDDDDCPHR